MLSIKLTTYATAIFVVFNCWSNGIQARSYVGAGLLGNYAGHLTAGKALLQLHHAEAADTVAAEKSDDYGESESAATAEHYETLGDEDEHLQEHHFPQDYSGHEHTEGFAYAEEESEAAATAHHPEIESFDSYEHHSFHEPSHHESAHYEHAELQHFANEIHGSDDDFHSKPIRGIDHGKGAFSYSTLYEFKDV